MVPVAHEKSACASFDFQSLPGSHAYSYDLQNHGEANDYLVEQRSQIHWLVEVMNYSWRGLLHLILHLVFAFDYQNCQDRVQEKGHSSNYNVDGKWLWLGLPFRIVISSANELKLEHFIFSYPA